MRLKQRGLHSSMRIVLVRVSKRRSKFATPEQCHAATSRHPFPRDRAIQKFCRREATDAEPASSCPGQTHAAQCSTFPSRANTLECPIGAFQILLNGNALTVSEGCPREPPHEVIPVLQDENAPLAITYRRLHDDRPTEFPADEIRVNARAVLAQ